MRENIVAADKPGYPEKQDVSSLSPAAAETGGGWPIGIILCTLVFVMSILLMVTPLIRMPDTGPVLVLNIPLGSFVGAASSWLPLNLEGIHQSSSSNSLEFFCLVTLAFLIYGLGMLLVGRQAETNRQFPVRACIWLGACLAGAICLVTPALLSRDMLVYTSYSRLLTVYHANPYFVLFSSFPRDPLLPFDQWSQSVSAYGPIWMLVCGLLGWLNSPDPTPYIIAFRLLALAMNLLNIWLIGRTLKTMNRSPRVVTLGMLFYAWNPLILLESGLDGHIDIFMITLVLTGVLLAVRAEKNDWLLRARGYLPPVVALTMAALVKFTALPILAAYLLFLACRALRPAMDDSPALRQALSYWKRAIAVLAWSSVVALLVVAVFYGPFWIGHGLREISYSFTSPPSSTGAKHSFLLSLIDWLQLHPAEAQNQLLVFLSQRRFWDDLNYLLIAICLGLGAIKLWLKPAVGTFITLALAMMCLVLLFTPWFYAWYITWIVSLAAVCSPTRARRTTWALLIFVLVFSYSAFSVYISGFLGSKGYLWPFFNTLPPVCAFLICWKTHPDIFDLLKGRHADVLQKRADKL